MGWFSFKKPRPVEDLRPVLDLAHGIVCDLGRDDTRLTIAQRLGPPTHVDRDRVGYSQLMLTIDVAKRGTITGWNIIIVTPETMPPWPGLPANEADVVARLGPPTKRETDAEELMLSWVLPRMEVFVDFGLAGGLHDIFVDFT